MSEAFAIDPGQGGGIAYKYDGWNKADTMPDTVVDLADKLRELKCGGFDICYLEEIPKFAGKNASAMMKLSTRYGECRGILATLGIKVYEFTPQAWQKALGLGNRATHGNRWKAHLKERSQALNPHLKVTLKTADALLILEAGNKLTQ
jgi:hypothetical protein